MKTQTFTFEHLLYLLIFLLALGVRITSMAQMPLSDFEADYAMRAVQVSRGEAADLGNQPGYVLLTGLIFFLAGSGEATARLWPVLMVSALVFLPYLVREHLGRKAALVAAVGFAIDPGLVTLSQLAGGPILAISFLLLAVVVWVSGRPVAGGILAGLALLSGPSVLAGGIALAGAVGIVRLAGIIPAREEASDEQAPLAQDEKEQSPARAGLLAVGGTLLLAGTLFLRYPQGLSAFASALPNYLAGWSVPSDVPVSRLFIVLLSYPLLAVLFGLIGWVRSWLGEGEIPRIGRGLSIWLCLALVLALLYPGRQVFDLAWVLVPLWGLAAIEFSRYLENEKGLVIPWPLAGLVVVMLASVWINLAGLTASNAQGQVLMLRWLVIGGAFLLAILSTILVGLGWSEEGAKRGLAWGTAMALGLAMFAGIWAATQREIIAQLELWRPAPGAGQQALLQRTLGDLGDWTRGREDSIQVISLVDTPSVRWALRNMPNAQFQETLSREALPEVILAHQNQPELSLGSAYRGQDFIWWVYPNWDVWTGREWMKWLLFREGAGYSQGIILWARGDLFPSGTVEAEASLP
jgi:hypothetical protein